MPTLTLVRGLPGSGKSTLAKALSSASGAYHYEADMYLMRYGVYKFDPKRVRGAHEWCRTSVAEILAQGADVIVSNTFTQKWEMQPYFDLAEQYGYKVQIIECKADFGNIHNVPKDAIDRMNKRWEQVDVLG